MGLQSGIRLHEVQIFSREKCKIPVGFPGEIIWMGYVKKGSLTVLLPDLGRKTIEKNDWFICRLDDFRVTDVPDCKVEILAFSVCHCMMESLIALADESVAEHIECFACPNQLKPTLLQGSSTQRLEWLAKNISVESSESLPGRLELEARCLDWISELFRQPDLSSTHHSGFCCSAPDEDALRNVARHLEQSLAEEHSLADLSRRFHINEFKLKRGFKAMFDNTVFGYLRELRFQRAEQLLKQDDWSVLEIANEVGYSNPSHFARGFQERFGLLPKAFQRIHQPGK